MAASTDFNYADILSLEKAKLVKRSRLNFLGSKELVLDYHNIGSASKEECVEWLDDNRLTLTNPTFSYKTYTGVWKCIDISYDEDTKILRQRFKIDSSLGDLDGSSGSMTGTGDLVQVSAGSTVERAYYWRVVDPSAIELPSSSPDGTIYTKSAVDNGDGTYDLTVSKETASNLTATSAIQAGGSNSVSNDIVVYNAGTTAVNGTYTDQGTFSGKTYWGNGSYYLFWNTLSGGQWNFSTATSGQPVLYYISSTASEPPTGGYTVSGAGTSPGPDLIVGNGSGGPYREASIVNTNDNEKTFSASPSGPDEIQNAVDGEVKTISNIPLENGKFRSSVTTRTAKSLRIPSPEGYFLSYASDYLASAKGIIKGRNRTYSEFTSDIQLLSFAPYVYRINNVSFNINDFGLFDYTITSDVPG